MEQPEQNVATSTPLPKPAALQATRPDASVSDTPGAHVFDTKNVSIYYGSFRAVTDVSLTIYENEITAFIGPSGCGKTTVLRTLNRMNDLVPGARVEGDVHYRGASLYAQGRLPDRRAPAHRHGLPEAEPVPEVDLRQRRLRAAHQRRAQQGQAERDRRALAAPGRAVGRGEGPAEASRAWACPAGRRSGCASPARSPSSRTSSSWTSPARRSTRSRRARSRT